MKAARLLLHSKKKQPEVDDDIEEEEEEGKATEKREKKKKTKPVPRQLDFVFAADSNSSQPESSGSEKKKKKQVNFRLIDWASPVVGSFFHNPLDLTSAQGQSEEKSGSSEECGPSFYFSPAAQPLRRTTTSPRLPQSPSSTPFEPSSQVKSRPCKPGTYVLFPFSSSSVGKGPPPTAVLVDTPPV